MTLAELTPAEASTPSETRHTPVPTCAPPSQDVEAAADHVPRPETAQETQHNAQPEGNAESVIRADGSTSRPKETLTRPSPRAAAATANAVIAEQVKEEEAPLGVVMVRALVEPVQMDTWQPETTATRPSRAAAAAANAGMARQAKEEQGTLGMLISTTFTGPLETKKRVTEATSTPALKRSKITTDRMLASEEQQPRGKKRRQAPVYDVMEASPIITDLPPLPFTSTSPQLVLKSKKPKSKQPAKTKKLNLTGKELEGDDTRHCEFCKKVANICVLMHCHACRRVYHAGCYVHMFKPYVDDKVPILDQMERLQLEAPERRGNIFRCPSCKAAFLDFYESGGFLWDCDCPTCSQPEKVIYYRQRKLVQMMNDMELEKQRKKEKKSQKKSGTVGGSGKQAASMSVRSNWVSHSRRTRGSRTTPDDYVSMRTLRSRGVVFPEDQELEKDLNAVKAEAGNEDAHKSKDGVAEVIEEDKVESMDCGGFQLAASETTKPEDDQIGEHKAQDSESNEVMETLESQVALEPQQQASASMQLSIEPTTQHKQEEAALKIEYEPVSESELSGDDLVNAVRVLRDEKNGGWCFPVMCSRTSSLRVSGIMKSGNCKWFPKKTAFIQCDCCDKRFKYPEFVHHTDSSLIKNTKSANEDPMPFLFVEHRDNTQHTPLDNFLPFLRSWAQSQSANNTPINYRRGRTVKQETLVVTVVPTTITTAAVDTHQTPVSRLQALALFKRPKQRSEKSSSAARLSDPSSLSFVAHVVCLSPKYVMSMQNGSLADRVERSKTPAPGDSFPRKAGWLAFNCKAATARQITCFCCENRFNFDDFVGHAGISLNEFKKKPRQLLYVVERQDASALVPFNTFQSDLEFVTNNGVDLFLEELRPPPPSPRPS